MYLKSFKACIEDEIGRLKTLETDHGDEYCSKAFEERSQPFKLQQNSVSEREKKKKKKKLVQQLKQVSIFGKGLHGCFEKTSFEK